MAEISFICDYTNTKNYKLSDLLNYKFYDLMDEANFSISISGKIFFSEPNFCILEFLQQIALWKQNRGDFHYHCVDTDVDPLISFIKTNGKFTVSSPWQKFECNDMFEFSDLIAVERILETELPSPQGEADFI